MRFCPDGDDASYGGAHFDTLAEPAQISVKLRGDYFVCQRLASRARDVKFTGEPTRKEEAGDDPAYKGKASQLSDSIIGRLIVSATVCSQLNALGRSMRASERASLPLLSQSNDIITARGLYLHETLVNRSSRYARADGVFSRSIRRLGRYGVA